MIFFRPGSIFGHYSGKSKESVKKQTNKQTNLVRTINPVKTTLFFPTTIIALKDQHISINF